MYIFVLHKKKPINEIWAGTAQCSCCNHVSHFHLKRLKHKTYIMGFIPFISYTEKRYLECDSCSGIKELTRKEYRKIYNEQVEKLDNKQIPPEVIRHDYSPEELKMGWRWAKLIVSLLFALSMVFVATAMSHEVDDIFAVIMSLVMFLPAGVFPFYFVLTDFIVARKKQKIYNEVLASSYVVPYSPVYIDEYGNVQGSVAVEPSSKRKIRFNQMIGVALMLLFFLPVISYFAGQKENQDSSSASKDDPSSIETPCFDHDFEQIDRREPTYQESGLERFACKNCGYEYDEDIPILNSVQVIAINKMTHEYYDDSLGFTEESLIERFAKRRIVAFDIQIKNITDRDIKKVSGDLVIEVGTNKITLNCDFEDMLITAGETVLYEAWGFEYNPNDYGGLYDTFAYEALYEADFKDIKFSFYVTETIFENQP